MATPVPILNNCLYVHFYSTIVGKTDDGFLRQLTPFFVGCGDDYSFRRYTDRPFEWESVVRNRGKQWFVTEVIFHNLTKEHAKRLKNAAIYWYYVQGWPLINDLDKKRKDKRFKYEELAQEYTLIDYLDKLFSHEHEVPNEPIKLNIKLGMRNYKKFLTK